MSKKYAVALLRSEVDVAETRRLLREIASGEYPLRKSRIAEGGFRGTFVGDWFHLQRSMGRFTPPYISGRLGSAGGTTEIAVESEVAKAAKAKILLTLSFVLPILLALSFFQWRSGEGAAKMLGVILAYGAGACAYYMYSVKVYPSRFRTEVVYLADLLSARVVDDVAIVRR